ncbi:transmembrane protein 70 homolog, mitochondrial [Brevipalpus obovatus]|uniref:transmembrane protein 70 homolog, mitochondrial n=1 Tax=Brevipalpus obovatus TaxID=246614 RepID=UPI003D9E07F9
MILRFYLRNRKLSLLNLRCSFTITSKLSSSSNQNQIVYQGLLAKKIKVIKWFSLSTSAISLMAQPIIYLKAQELGSSLFAAGFMSMLSLIVFPTPLLLNLVTKRYVNQLDYDPEHKLYTAHTLNILNRPVKTIFKPSDLEVLTPSKIFANVLVNKGVELFLELKDINNAEALENLLPKDMQDEAKFESFEQNEFNNNNHFNKR